MALLIIGCGNLDRGDDAVGVLVVRRLQALGIKNLGVEVIEQSGESFSLMDSWTGREHVILVDATAPSGTPGQVRLWNARADRLPDVLPSSTHAFGVREAVELARVMNCLPQTLVVYGIEGRHSFLGSLPSREVKRAVVSVAERLVMQVSGQLVQTPQDLRQRRGFAHK
ncbi:MAG: hydrogenase maturation protease [Candidatus Sulfotelmatobacter sp.]